MTVNLTPANIGKSFKARGGWRAQLCEITGHNACLVYHSMPQDVHLHKINGQLKPAIVLGDYDLIEPWREPVRKTVIYHTCLEHNWASSHAKMKSDTHRITFDTIDGEPDCASIRMEKLS